MAYALMSSGGKDSNLALDRARRDGLDVRFLVNIHDGVSGRVAFHGVREPLIHAQAEVCGLEYVSAATGEQPYEPVFLTLLDTLVDRGARGVIFGNVHLADVRAWYEKHVSARGLEHVEPLWHMEPIDVVRGCVDRGFRAIVVSVDEKQRAGDLFGREIDKNFVRAVAGRSDIDACGERGEYHTFVYDGPTFSAPIAFSRGSIREDRGHRLLDLIPNSPASAPTAVRSDR